MKKLLLILFISTSLFAQLRPTPTNIPSVDRALIKVYEELNKLQKVTDTDCNDYVEMAGTLCKAIGIGTTKTSNAVTVYDKGELGSQSFLRGWQLGKGWKLYNDSSDYTLELDNLTLRGTLSVWELIINQIRATNGNLIVSSVAKVSGSSGSYFDCEDVTGHGVAPFFVNDIIMCQVVNLSAATFDGNGDVNNNQYLVKRLIYRVTNVTGLRVTYTALAGTPANKGVPKKGDTFVRIGNTDLATNPTRGGTIGMYTDEVYSPFIRICDQVDSWADWKSIASVKTQIGRLGGLVDGNFPEMKDEYGLYSKGGIYLTNGKIVLADSGYIRSGQTAYHTGTGFWLGKTGGVGKFSVGNPAGNFLVWDGTQLYVNGNVTLSNSIPITNVTGLNDTIVNHRSAITLNAGNINLKVSRSTLLDSIVAYINLSPTTIDISASKVNVYGIFKAFNGSSDSTVIDGNKLKTGTVRADSVSSTWLYAGTIDAAKITTGYLHADRIQASSITAGKMNVQYLSAMSANLGSVTAGSIVITTGSDKIWLNDGSDGSLQIGGGTKASAPFRVTAAGAMTASSGSIGSFTIGTYLYTGSKTAYNDANAGVHIGSDGIGIGNNVFTVSSVGAVNMTNANVYGNFSQGTGDAVCKITTSGIQLGDATFLDAPFRVDMNGAMTATSATITGAGITGGTIQTAASGKRIVLNSTDNSIDIYNATGLQGTIYGASGGGIYVSGTIKSTSGFVLDAAFTLMQLEPTGLLYGNPSGQVLYSEKLQFGDYGGSYDVNLYRSAANLLKTDDTFECAGLIIGSVSNTEVGYLDGVTSAIQTQINGKQAADADLTDLADGLLTASKIDYSGLTNGVMTVSYGTVGSTAGWTGTFTDADSNVYTVTGGIITGKNL